MNGIISRWQSRRLNLAEREILKQAFLDEGDMRILSSHMKILEDMEGATANDLGFINPTAI